MAKNNICQELLDLLADCSNRQIWGVFGDAINPLSAALREDKRFEWIGVRHEEAGAFAASAQAKLTDKLGLCAGTVGPGAIHLLNGMYDAKMDHAPLLAITGQVPRSEVGSDYHQEVNLDRLFDDVCVYNQTIMTASQMPRLGILAAQYALANRGVSHLSIPSDVGPQAVENTAMEHPIFIQDAEVVPHGNDLDRAAEAINGTDKVTLMVGWGARGATAEITALAEKLKAPVMQSLKGKAVLSEDHPHWAGGIGLLGTKGGVAASEHCDVLVLLGTDFPYRQFYPKGKTIIQVDIASQRLGRRTGVKIGLCGHVRSTVEALLERVDTKSNEAHLKQMQKARDAFSKHIDKQCSLDKAKAPIHPQQLARALSNHATDSTIFTADTGECPVWMARCVHMRGDRDFLMSFNHASMANAMVHALGAQALDRSRQVVAMCGDGGFSMLMSDFITAVNYNLPIKCAVFNNGILGLVKMEMESMGYPEWGIDLKNPSFAACAEAMGGTGIRVEDPADLDDAVKKALATDGPVVLDVLTNRNELTMPPNLIPAKAWGFSLAKSKEMVITVEEKIGLDDRNPTPGV
ncbi:MAG: thiamine pyrophosphate-dependent enzyme [Planctomycetota bacterium]|nr:thiamine pyrophosphate-dependent enzyme [Planctomycetota bacterium]